ncbi:MAG: choice-of-anchor Q domain-containing protein, partial [Pyrinomonadaceae bacterium]
GAFSQMNDIINIDPMLDALADNGGNVTTHSLQPNSPAINAGLNVNAIDPFDSSVLMYDARGLGYDRIIFTVDKGAFETLVPTAANVSISGRVFAGEQGLKNAQVVLTDQYGNRKTVLTGSFGYFNFEDLAVGETYFIRVFSKRYQFSPQVITPFEDLSEINFSAEINE